MKRTIISLAFFSFFLCFSWSCEQQAFSEEVLPQRAVVDCEWQKGLMVMADGSYCADVNKDCICDDSASKGACPNPFNCAEIQAIVQLDNCQGCGDPDELRLQIELLLLLDDHELMEKVELIEVWN